jgi:hypothetical protein
MCRIISRANRTVRRIEGQTMAEYAVVLAVVTSGGTLLFLTLGNRVIGVLTDVVGLFH